MAGLQRPTVARILFSEERANRALVYVRRVASDLMGNYKCKQEIMSLRDEYKKFSMDCSTLEKSILVVQKKIWDLRAELGQAGVAVDFLSPMILSFPTNFRVMGPITKSIKRPMEVVFLWIWHWQSVGEMPMRITGWRFQHEVLMKTKQRPLNLLKKPAGV